MKKFVGVGLYTTGAAGLLLPKDVVAATSMADFGHETVQSIANGQILARNMKSVFQQQNGYDLDAYRNACWLMRDAKDGNAMVQIDVGLLNLMYAMQEWARQSGRSNPVITINSAYRTPRRNATIEGAARNSLHMRGKAVDFTMRGWALASLSKWLNTTMWAVLVSIIVLSIWIPAGFGIGAVKDFTKNIDIRNYREYIVIVFVVCDFS